MSKCMKSARVEKYENSNPLAAQIACCKSPRTMALRARYIYSFSAKLRPDPSPKGAGQLGVARAGPPGLLAMRKLGNTHNQQRAPTLNSHCVLKPYAPTEINPTETDTTHNTMARSKPIQSKTTTSDRPRRTIVPPQ